MNKTRATRPYSAARVAILLTNYNMPERTDALCEHIQRHVKWPHDLIVVDNGSDIVPPSRYTTLEVKPNRQTTGGWLAGLHRADIMEQVYNEPYLAYWFLITSAEFINERDPLTPLAELLLSDPDAAGVHPALSLDSVTAWSQLHTRGSSGPRRTWMIDNIASLYRADWFNANGRFDPRLTYAWGIDLETCYKARQQGRTLWVHEGVEIRKVTDIGYTMGRMNMSAGDRQTKASEQMNRVLAARYGPDWYAMMTGDYLSDAIR